MLAVRSGWIFAVSFVAAAGPMATGQQWRAVRLNPPAAIYSRICAVGPGVQGGLLRTRDSQLPVLWRGSSTGWTPLAYGSRISGSVFAIAGAVQGGQLNGRASLWMGSAASLVDLQPSDARSSCVLAVLGDKQAGWADRGNGLHRAVLWSGTAASLIDLNPVGASESSARAMDGARQVVKPGSRSPEAASHPMPACGAAPRRAWST